MKPTLVIALMLLLSSQAFAFVYLAEGGDGAVTIDANSLTGTLWSDTDRTLFSKADLLTPLINFRVIINSNDHICIQYTRWGIDHTECGNAVINPDEWLHYAVVFNTTSNEIKIYLNGTLNMTASLYAPVDDTPSQITMGRNANSAIQYYGLVDRARAYPEALNQTMIAADMGNMYQQDPAHYSWDFDLPSNSTAYDTHLEHWNTLAGIVMATGDYDDSVQCITYDAPGDEYFQNPLIRLILDNLLLLAALGILVTIGVVMVIRT